jgi:CubicO group peptidase (beta-lactamase class C family)
MVAFVLIAVAAPGSRAQSDVCFGDPLDLERFTDRFFHRYLTEFSGASLALAVVQDGRLILGKGYGVIDDTSRRPVTTETVFHVASLSKVATAVAVLRLAQEGRVDLDADVNRYLTGFSVPSDPARPVTLAHLMTHTSGLEGPFLGGLVDRPADLVPLRAWFATHPLRRAGPPGVEVRYSNEGMSLAGHVVEAVTGRTFEQAIESEVLMPIGMRSSTFLQPPPPGIATRVATAGAGRVPDALVLRPAGAMVSSAEDMSRLMVEILQGGGALEPETANELRARHWTGHPAIPGVSYGLFEAEVAGRRVLWHTGARVHFSILAFVPEERLGVFLVHSMRQGGSFQELRVDFVRALIERCGHADPRPAGGSPAGKQSPGRAGIYRPAILPSMGVTRLAWLVLDTPVEVRTDGALMVALPGGEEPLVLRPLAAGAFTDGRGNYAGFQGPRLFLSALGRDPLTLRRLAWYERGRLHAVLMASAALVLVAFPSATLLLAVFRRFRGRPRLAAPRGPRAARAAAIATGFLFAAAPILTIALVLATSIDEGANGLRRVLAIGLGIVTVAAILSATLPVFAAWAWRRGWWTAPRRVAYTAVAAAAVVLMLFLIYYRALIFWL